MSTDDFRPGRIAEGLCPTHATPLERRESDGWCSQCRLGFSIEPESFAVTFEVDLSAFGGADD